MYDNNDQILRGKDCSRQASLSFSHLIPYLYIPIAKFPLKG